MENVNAKLFHYGGRCAESGGSPRVPANMFGRLLKQRNMLAEFKRWSKADENLSINDDSNLISCQCAANRNQTQTEVVNSMEESIRGDYYYVIPEENRKALAVNITKINLGDYIKK